MNQTECTFERCEHDRENPYVMISRDMAQDKSISPKAKGVLLYLLSLPKNWKVYHSQLQSGLGVGEDYINSAMDELIKEGYAERSRERINGMFQAYKYKIREFKKCLPNRKIPFGSSYSDKTPSQPIFNQTGSTGPVNPGIQNKQSPTEIKETTTKQTFAPTADVVVSSKSSKKKQEKINPISQSSTPILCNVDIPYNDKIEITNKFSPEIIRNALEFTEANKDKIKTCYVAYLKMACQKGLKIPDKPVNKTEVNKAYARKYDMMKNSAATIEAFDDRIEICYYTSKPPFILKYSEHGFKDQLDSALRKDKFKIL